MGAWARADDDAHPKTTITASHIRDVFIHRPMVCPPTVIDESPVGGGLVAH
jgi:hypothetical protein